jgi:DNA helicase-2/ATP-dependent DNA helicase PcrA
VTGDDLNEPQADAVAHVDGPLLVFAGAGSGKTRVITYRIANLVATHGVPPYRILAVTFTNKAAGEMRERLRGLLGDEIARDLWVGTFHATCARLLRRHHAAVGLGRDFLIYDDSDQRSLVNRIVKEKKIDDKRHPPRRILSIIHAHKQEGLAPGEVDRRSYVDDVALEVYEAYERGLRAANACDFDDLLLHVLRLVERPDPDYGGELEFPPREPDPSDEAGAAIRKSFRHVLVDEFQDTNAVQYRLVRAIVRDHGNLAVVGDDDQSIYSWRGADVRNIRGFERDFPGAHVVRLEQNYRSTQRIVRAALSVIAPSRERVPKDLWTANAEGDAVTIRSSTDERDEAAQVVGTIGAWVREGWSRREIAILYRTHAQSRVLEEALRGARLAYRIVGGLRFFDRAEIKDLLGYLRLVVNPRSDVDLLRVINVPARGIGDTTVDRVTAIAQAHGLSMLETLDAIVEGRVDSPIAQAARKKLGVFLAIMRDLAREAAAGTAPSVLASLALERTGYLAALDAEGTAEATTRAQNLAELVGSIRDFEEIARAQGEAPTLAAFLERTALVTTADETKSDDSVTMMTVHAAKGLEYRGVLIAGLEDDLFPYKGARARDDEAFVGQEEQDLEEERRLAYVAITRARERLVLLHAAQRTLFGQTRYGRPSRFLRDLPGEDLVHLGPRRESIAPRGWASAGPSSSRTSTFRHPQAHDARMPGERFVERDEDLPSPSPPPATRYVERDEDERRTVRVRHKKFGVGQLISVVEGAEPKVVVAFPGWGTMTILRRFVELDG